MAVKKRTLKRFSEEDLPLLELHRVGMLENPHDVGYHHGDGSRTIESEDGGRRRHVKTVKKPKRKQPRKRK